VNAATDDATEDECKIDTLPCLKEENKLYYNTIIQGEQLLSETILTDYKISSRHIYRKHAHYLAICSPVTRNIWVTE